MPATPVPTPARPSIRAPRTPPGWRWRTEVLVRTVVAVAGGYFLAHAFSALCASALPFSRPDRVVAGALLAFPVWCAAAVYAFGARDWRRAVVRVPGLALALLGLATLLAAQATRP